MKYKKLFKKKRKEDYKYVIAKEQPLSYVTENLQKTILNLEFTNVDGNFKVIQFTSTVQGEGKTTLINNIGYLLADRSKKVLVIDMDLRRPKIHKTAKVPNENGITDYLLGDVEFKDVIQRNENLNLDFIVAGKETTAITNALTSDKLKNLINELKDKYDYILLDTPPTYIVSDSYYISNIADGIIYVVGQNIARRKDLRDSFNELKKTETPIIGIIMSQVKLRKGEYYYYYGRN